MSFLQGLFSLAPAVPKPASSKSDENLSQPCRPTLPEVLVFFKITIYLYRQILATIRSSLDRNKARMTSKNVSTEKLVHIGPKGEKLVPMHEAKR